MRYIYIGRLLCFSLLAAMGLRMEAAGPIDFTQDIQPILNKYCVGCHTAGDENGGLRLDSFQSLSAGGESGVSVTPGAPQSSRLILMVQGKLSPVMPPEDEPGPGEDEIEKLVRWVESGAAGPVGDADPHPTLRTPKISTRQDLSKPITAVALARDGSRQAIARFGSIEIRSSDGKLISTISDLPGKVNALEFNRQGTRILAASGLTGSYGRAMVFDVATGALKADLSGHRDTLYAATFSPDESLVATAGYDRTIVIWDVTKSSPIRKLEGHNGAVFDLAFSPDGSVLASACADETVKIWQVSSGQRLDTLSQPEGEVYSVAITLDGKFVLAGSADNRLRVWRLVSKTKPMINPIVATRFLDESPVVNFSLTPNGKSLVVLSESGNVKMVRVSDWNQFATLEPLQDAGTDIAVLPDSNSAVISQIDGAVVRRNLPAVTMESQSQRRKINRVYLELGDLQKTKENELRGESKAGDLLAVDRGAEISGAIDAPGQIDQYRWDVNEGEMWAIDADANKGSPIDPIITILNSAGKPVLRTRLQATRDSYFTFRGKDSKQVGDFRVFNWQEMKLNEYLYASGEVTRLWLYPRGPDSGFNVYPGEGNRWTYFGTTHTTHALGEPAYIVRPLEADEPALANGLPVFNVYYENDDDPMRLAGKNSRLLFHAPADASYTLAITDTTGLGNDKYRYVLRIRPAFPDYRPSIQAANGTLRRGTGREFIVRADRTDGFDGPIEFHVSDLPSGIRSNGPITIEPGQRFAIGTIWAEENAPSWENKVKVTATAKAMVAGRMVEKDAGMIGEFTLGDQPNVIPSLQPIDQDFPIDENWTLEIPRGQTATARVVMRRKEGFNGEVSFGKEGAGRNGAQGVYVDNIGLNGLLVRANNNERVFFVTVDATTKPGKRSFFLKANVDGGVTTHPITIHVLP